MRGPEQVLVLGFGNRLRCDDAAGPMAVDLLAASASADGGAIFCDGGTIGLGLLPLIADLAAFIAVDAAKFGGVPGTVRVFEGRAMDEQLGGRKRSAHELALADLMAAAALNDRLPLRRALVAVEPASTVLGLEPTAAVAAAIPRMCTAVNELLQQWKT